MSKNPLSGATQVVRNHPVYSVLALFALAGGTLVVANNRRNKRFEDIDLPEATEVRDTDGPLKDATRADRKGDDTAGGSDPISEGIRP